MEEAIEQTWGVHAEMDWLDPATRNAMCVRGPYSTPRPPGEETMNAHGSCPARPGQTSGGGFAWHPHEPDESVDLHTGVGLVHKNMVTIGILDARVCKHCRTLYVPTPPDKA